MTFPVTTDSWLEITLWLPLLAIPLIVVALLVPTAILLRRRRARRQADTAAPATPLLSEEEEAARSAYRQFIYNVSHEFANPLQSIQTNLDNMVACAPDEAERRAQYHEIIAGEIQRLGRMNENLRVLSRLETPNAPANLEAVNLKGLAEEVIIAYAETAEARGLKLVYVGPGRPVRVLGNRDQLRQLLLNLVDNGVKFSRDDQGLVTIGLEQKGDRILARVSDQGVGIALEDMPRIFEATFRAPNASSFRRPGSGLGLTLARRIVEQHGGRIWAESRVGEGTTVWFELPAAAGAEATAT